MRTIRTEEYVEIIYEICLEKDVAKVSDIKEKLDLSSLASVTEMVQKLNEQGLINYEKYRGVTLTEKGISVAKRLLQKQKAIENLLTFINVKEDTAKQDACSIEHVISEESAEAISRFVCFLGQKENKEFLERLKKNYQKFDEKSNK
ncbi:MAG: metal-dependent transcriptional regulator [Candidatus Heimdallarchaeaceae archaeon]